MNPPKCTDTDYIDFLIATPRVCTATEASKVNPEHSGPAHDAYTRHLHRTDSDGESLWSESEPFVDKKSGILILDDSTLDKPYANKIELLTWHWSGKHKDVVKGINLISLLWTDGEAKIPCDFRLYNKRDDGLTKNDHFRNMIDEAVKRGFVPELVVFDNWYASLKNLKHLGSIEWHWLCQLKSNRQVNPDGKRMQAIANISIPENGRKVRLKGYGLIKVFRKVARNGDYEYWATSNLDITTEQIDEHSSGAWNIEVYHRGLKQYTGVEKCQHRKEKAQRNHIGLSIRAFLRLEVHRISEGISWFNAKMSIIRQAVSEYLKNPKFKLTHSTA